MSYDDEYYCPNCGAILNDQYGFDPNNGTWTCTSCGKLLMDDDIYEGDTFEGVAWHCDNCNALLNRQYGFSDSYGTWTCTECGHTNGITEDDIINEISFTCPNCGDTLNNQCCFNKYDDNWTCTSCGAHLHHSYSDDEYSVVESEEEKLKCPNCGDILNNQCLFNEYDNNWTCTSCGAKLHHNYNDDAYTIVKEDDEVEEPFTDRYYQSEESTQKTKATPHKSAEIKKDKNFYCPNCGSTLSKQYGFDNNVDEYTCKVCQAQLYHYYTDEPYKIKQTRTKATHTVSHTYNNSNHQNTYSSSASKRQNNTSKSNDWFMFFICAFLGFIGVHKFIEKRWEWDYCICLRAVYFMLVGLLTA